MECPECKRSTIEKRFGIFRPKFVCNQCGSSYLGIDENRKIFFIFSLASAVIAFYSGLHFSSIIVFLSIYPTAPLVAFILVPRRIKLVSDTK